MSVPSGTLVRVAAKYDLALDEGRRGLDRQSADLSGLRDRTTTLLGVGGTLATVLGGLAIRDGAELHVWTYLSVGAFSALAAVSVFVLWPRPVSFTHDPAQLIAAADVPNATTDHLTEHLAEQMGRQYDKNKKVLDRLVSAFSVAAALFGVEAVALLLDLRGR